MKITNQQRVFYEKALLFWRNWRRLLVAIVLLPSFGGVGGGCHKDPYQDIMYAEGRVVEKGKIQNPVAGAKVILYKIFSTQLGGAVSFVALDTVISDANGNYRLETTGEPNTVYHIAALGDPEQFWNRSDEPYDGNGLNYGKKNVNTLFIQPYSFVQVHVKNTKPVDEEDAISIGGDWPSFEDGFFKGSQTDETFVRRIIGNGDTNVAYKVYKSDNKEPLYGKETNFAQPHDTLKININY